MKTGAKKFRTGRNGQKYMVFSSLSLKAFIFKIPCRTRCRNRKFLSTKGDACVIFRSSMLLSISQDTLCGHVDRSEVCATSPLVSISYVSWFLIFFGSRLMELASLGNAAIFLIGGLTRSIQPVSILLRSGDIIVMSGPGCRRAYHGELSMYIKSLSDPHFLLLSRCPSNIREHASYTSPICGKQ